MEKWRKKGDRFNQEFTRTNSDFNYNYSYSKPPLGGSSNWQQNVPYWEKRFVSVVGSLSWKKFMEAKKFTHLYKDVMEWDDTAGEAAFRVAKDRFNKKFHGLPCDVEHHSPNLYIDEIDWNAQVDQNLILDLEAEPVAPDVDSVHEPVVIFGDVLPDPYKNFSPYGWGDSDDDKIKNSWGVNDEMKGDQNGINWDDYIQNGRIIWDDCNVGGGNEWWVANESDNKAGDLGWVGGGNDTWVTNENTNKAGNQGWVGGGNDWCVSNENDNKAGDQGWNTNLYNNDYSSSYGNVNNERYVSSHKTQRFQGNNSQRGRSWRSNGNRKSTGQGHGNQRAQGSTFQTYGSQRIHVRP